jgi:hypothetical protein
MILSEIKEILANAESLNFVLQNGERVPEHFHVTEVGVSEKRFIDCGGTLRSEQKVVFQLWNAQDYDHRLKPAMLLGIIGLSEKRLNLPNAQVEVEYQADTVGLYELAYDGAQFVLMAKQTACLAADQCGIPAAKDVAAACCSGSGCC